MNQPVTVTDDEYPSNANVTSNWLSPAPAAPHESGPIITRDEVMKFLRQQENESED